MSLMFQRPCWPLVFLLVYLSTPHRAVQGDAPVAHQRRFAQQFQQSIQPLLQQHCLDCHDAATREAELDLSRFQTLDDVTASHQTWEIVLQRVEAGEMPPPDVSAMGEEERRRFVDWMRGVRDFEAARTAGDPGPVLARRLSNAEYDHSIRDLTGVDIKPTQTFPVDPANEAGFDNSGESLAMSPALMRKYLDAARTVVEHLLLTPDGIRFAPHPVVTDTDRDKYCVKRIVAFYQRQPTRIADYLFAAWLHHRAEAPGKGAASLKTRAEQQAISPRYLATLWKALQSKRFETGPMAAVQNEWDDLKRIDDRKEARIAADELAAYIERLREPLSPSFDNLHVQEIHKGAQAFVLWKNDQYASMRRKPDYAYLEQGRDEVAEPVLWPTADRDRTRFEASCEAFCDVFPNAFYISERGRDYLGVPKEKQEKGRLLSAGFHSMMGYYRDDQPLCDLILDEAQRRELDRLWQELDFICAAPQRQYQGFLWFERTDSRYLRDPQFDFARPENNEALSEEAIERLSDLYLKKAIENGGKGVALEAIRDYFDEMNARIRSVEESRRNAEAGQLQAVIDLAETAFRRPVGSSEQAELRDFYHFLREEQQQTHREAIEDTLVSILVSPRFSYRWDLLSNTDEPRALSDVELASRLSFFLWASLPDEPLRRAAREGRLSDPEVLVQQTRRMLKDPRARGLATEFAANWLDVRRFEEHNSVDRERFPQFNDSLRKAMFEEPIRYFLDVVQQDGSVLDLLYGKHTFVNRPLAEHYGMRGLHFTDETTWQRIDDADAYGRGGLLPMAVFLTKNAPGLRTSPVKRGYWVVRRLLGEHIPPPPPDVPELPADESKLGELTLAETLARHRDHASCAGCHQRFDSIGLVFEGFGPVGERRSEDLGGRVIDTTAEFPDGISRTGLEGLKNYLRKSREDDFVDNLSRKLLSYALSRTLMLSDESLVQAMKRQAAAQQYRFAAMVETIVTSPQFMNKRGRDGTAPTPAAHGIPAADDNGSEGAE